MKKYLTIVLLSVLISLFGCSFLPSSSGKTPDEGNQTATGETISESSSTPTGNESKSPADSAEEKTKPNFLAFANGTLVTQKPTQAYGEKEDVIEGILSMIDGNARSGWASRKGNPENQIAVFELPARTTFASFGFDTGNARSGGVAAKDVTVEVSDTDGQSGFKKVLDATLKEKENDQRFAVSDKIPARWVRLTVKNNYGSPDYIQLMEFRGFGEQETIPPLENVSGIYKTSSGELHIKQEGTSIIGCYTYSYNYLIEGGIEGRTLKLITSRLEKDGSRKRDTKVIMNVSDDGKNLVGVWSGDRPDARYVGKWDGIKTSSEVGNCPHLPDLDKEGAAQNNLEENLAAAGRVIVYGINFDFNSDKIKAESKPTLDKIVAVLKENSAWKMTIEGHTDDVGGESYNQTLSEKRAASVKKYLVEAGIGEPRLKAKGFGLSKPIAENATEAGRSQNRRVELVKQ